MTIETSTANILLSAMLGLQCWIIQRLFKLSAKISVIATYCPKCRASAEFDTDRLNKTT